MPLRPNLARRLEVVIQRSEQLGDVAMAYGNAFRNPGSARCVDQVSDVIRCRRGWRGVWSGTGGRTDIDDRQVTPLEAAGQCSGGHRRDRGGVIEHERDARLR